MFLLPFMDVTLRWLLANHLSSFQNIFTAPLSSPIDRLLEICICFPRTTASIYKTHALKTALR